MDDDFFLSNVWNKLKSIFLESKKANGEVVMVFEYTRPEEGYDDDDMSYDEIDDQDTVVPESGVMVIFENDDKKICFTLFDKEQWEMVQDVSSIIDAPMEETLLSVIRDMNTVVFLDPEDPN